MVNLLSYPTTPTLEQFQLDPVSIISQPIMQKVYQMYDRISRSIREYLSDIEDFLEFKPPLIGPVTDPGIRGAKQVEIEYYGKDYKFMSSAILYKQLLALSRKRAGFPGNIYFFADNLRLEPMETANTDRHLVEFIQVDLEIADADHFKAMEVAEGLVQHIHVKSKTYMDDIKQIWDHFEEASSERGLVPRTDITIPTTPFKKYTYKELVEFLQDYISSHPESIKQIESQFGIKTKSLSIHEELPWEYEWLASSLHTEPFFIYDYPKGSRGFYDREYDDKSKTLMDFDLIFPHGYGEAISGAAREYRIEKIIPRMKETGENIKKYEWYLKFLKEYGQPTAGFGIGLERTVRYICGLPKIYMSLPYPKIPGVYNP